MWRFLNKCIDRKIDRKKQKDNKIVLDICKAIYTIITIYIWLLTLSRSGRERSHIINNPPSPLVFFSLLLNARELEMWNFMTFQLFMSLFLPFQSSFSLFLCLSPYLSLKLHLPLLPFLFSLFFSVSLFLVLFSLSLLFRLTAIPFSICFFLRLSLSLSLSLSHSLSLFISLSLSFFLNVDCIAMPPQIWNKFSHPSKKDFTTLSFHLVIVQLHYLTNYLTIYLSNYLSKYLYNYLIICLSVHNLPNYLTI